MSYHYAKLRVEPVRGIWWRWKATPISVDIPDKRSLFKGFDLELSGEYVDCHPFRFKGRTRDQAVARATRWMQHENARESTHQATTTYESVA